MKVLKETNQEGVISIENKHLILDSENDFTKIINGLFGIQIAKDGRIWICVNGIAFLRFKPIKKSRKEKS